jgi:UDP-N-acetylglucosamine:LPS N-acetylglucosamine transferase
MLDLKIVDKVLEEYLTTFFSKKFNKIMSKFKPDYIIEVYPTWQILVADYKKNIDSKFKYGVVITDSTINLQWYSKDEIIDKFFVISDEIKDSLIKKLPDRKNDIIRTFFPIEEKYFYDKENLNNKNITILLSSFKEELTIDILEKLKNEDFYDKITIIK